MKVFVALLVLLMIQSVSAQSMPTREVLTRTSMVESQYGRGTIFSIDVDGREYWITAKHMVTGAERPPYGPIAAKTVSVRILDAFSTTEKWTPVTFTVIDTDKDVDIVVLASPTPLLTSPFPSLPTDSSHSTMGGDCEFLGYPFGGTWRVTYDGMTQWMPLTKHCTLSNLGVENTMRGMTKSLDNKTERVWILDGINNKGFSGGPVLLGTGPAQKIMAVVSGYIVEPADLIKSEVKKSATKTTQSKQAVGVNSGFIIAYDISYAVDAIHKHPIGPLRTTAQGNN